MKGQILDFSIQTNSGVISGDDQNRYQFSGASWRGQVPPARGQKVDFTVDGTGQANDIYILSSALVFPTQVGDKNRIIAAILAFFSAALVFINFIWGKLVGALFI